MQRPFIQQNKKLLIFKFKPSKKVRKLNWKWNVEILEFEIDGIEEFGKIGKEWFFRKEFIGFPKRRKQKFS